MTLVTISELDIVSPKRTAHADSPWANFLPYYAGFPEVFVSKILKSADLPRRAHILDPWNGSGTTTAVAASLGYAATGLDINPVMIISARARLLPKSEANSLSPLAREIVCSAKFETEDVSGGDPLLKWFGPATAQCLRAIERSIWRHLIHSKNPRGDQISSMSCIAAAYYVALFATVKGLIQPFTTSNPTWVRLPRPAEKRVGLRTIYISQQFLRNVENISYSIKLGFHSAKRDASSQTILADTTQPIKTGNSFDLVITSPPYCTRLDYTTATRVELALLYPLHTSTEHSLSKRMIGSTKVPDQLPTPAKEWGRSCLHFLNILKHHSSKASQNYYYKTHVDYFDKMWNSLYNITKVTKHTAKIIMVIQDSYYKDVHNDVPTHISEMAFSVGMKLQRRSNFLASQSMAFLNTRSSLYISSKRPVESVLCFERF